VSLSEDFLVLRVVCSLPAPRAKNTCTEKNLDRFYSIDNLEVAESFARGSKASRCLLWHLTANFVVHPMRVHIHLRWANAEE